VRQLVAERPDYSLDDDTTDHHDAHADDTARDDAAGRHDVQDVRRP
jgi:hypothetical protein